MDILKQLTADQQIFYSIHDQSITYEDAYKQVKELSLYLAKLHGPIMIYGHKQIEVILCILGCVQSQRTYIMVDSSTPLIRVKEIVQLSKASVCIAIDSIELEGITVLTFEQLHHIDHPVIDDHNQIAYILFTSGSTGKPKGVPISYSNLKHFIESSTKSLKTAPCNLLSVSNFSFDLSLMDLYYALYSHCTIRAVDRNQKSDFMVMKEILKNINYIVATPTYYCYLLLDHDFNSVHYPELHTFFSCGERLLVDTARKLKERFPEAMIINAYGPTEATCFISYHIIDQQDFNRTLLPIGTYDTSFVEITIEDEEIVLNGKSVFGGYIHQAALPKRNGYYIYHTGDLGYIENGLLYIKQRKDDQIKYQGYRIELSDIEMNLMQINGIEQACVIPKYSNGIVKFLKAYVTGTQKNDIVIKQLLKKNLPEYMIPKTIIYLESMPMNENGKINRKELR